MMETARIQPIPSTTSAGKEAYTLSDQKTPEKFAAQRVTVIGTLDAKTKTIQVDSITAAK